MSALPSPLLLMEGTPRLEKQVRQARARLDDFESEIFVCSVNPRGWRGPLPWWACGTDRVGCVELYNPPLRAWRDGDPGDWRSWILFDGFFRHQDFRLAWRIARLIQHSNPHRVAEITADDLDEARVFIIHARCHTLRVRGAEYGPHLEGGNEE